jgi:hypothetical protein
MLDEQGHLECEIKELRLEIKENAETMDNLCNLLERNNEKLRKLKEMNHRTPSKPQAICMVSPHNSKLEYLDEQTVIVNGVKYRRVEEPKPMDDVIDRLVKKYQAQKLWNMVRDKLGYSIDCCDEIVDLVEKWLPEYQSAAGSQNVDTELLVDGFNHCLNKMKEKLR